MQICLLDKNNISLCHLFNEAFNISCFTIDIEKSLKNNVRFLCAIEDEKVLGSIMITTKYDPVKNIKSYYLDYVSVLLKYQNKKIGSSLLKEVENLGRKENISYIEFTSNNSRVNARKMYLKSGYSVRDTDVFIKKLS